MRDMLKRTLVSIHPEGRIFVAVFALVSLLLWLALPFLGIVGAVATLWCVYFFRDPSRVTPTRSGLVVSPADGVIEMVKSAIPPEDLNMGEGQRTRVSIFMNVFNVHVNRIPIDGEITGLAYRAGKFLNAALDKASEDNERQSVRMVNSNGIEIAFVQIAGLIARRIVCNLSVGQSVKAGERFGIIRFGSRVDIYLPEGIQTLVCVGQQMIAGETIIADLDSKESARTGDVR